MHRNVKKISAVSVILLATVLSGAKMNDSCAPTPPATCYPDDCRNCYCLGPENIIANAPVKPVTCNGDWVVEVAGFYWKAQEDGLEYAIKNSVIGSDGVTANREMNNLIESDFLTPNFAWDFGFKVGIGYNTTCDGWDIGVLWTRYSKGAHDTVCAEFDDNVTLLPIWSAFQSPGAGNSPNLFATEIDTFWKLDLDLVDVELGRQFWTGHQFSIRPHVGLRFASLNQSYIITHRGGSWLNLGQGIQAYNNYVDLDNDFKGVGLKLGLDSFWHFGCGWGLYGNFATSIIYGRFSLDHHENIRLAKTPFSKTRIYEAEESFRASRASIDLGFGIQWGGLFCDCKYGITVSLGWEHHLFFLQDG